MGTNGPTFTRVIRSLRNLRRYTDQPVPDDVLRDILEAGRWCGSASNRQPWQFLVIRDRGTRRRLSGLNPYADFFAEAPVCIAVVMEGEGTGLSFDAGRVTQNLLLAAHAHGVGCGNAWLRLEEHQRAALDILGIPPGYSVAMLIALGYPAPGDPMLPSSGRVGIPPGFTFGRKPLAELVHYDRFGQRDPTTPGGSA